MSKESFNKYRANTEGRFAVVDKSEEIKQVFQTEKVAKAFATLEGCKVINIKRKLIDNLRFGI